jgi:medium-chain acyl-[acyl-carrier-protein] hydrolase
MPTTEAKSVWLPALRPGAYARLRLICFPYAGGSASAYARWPERLPVGVDVRPVQMPGRWNRLSEPPLRDFDDAVRALVEVLPPFLDRPFALFGHSMGALLAFEVARRLREEGLPSPAHLFVSGRRGPQLTDDDLPGAELDDPGFIARLRELNGTPAELLERPELMKLLLPTIRADFDVCRTYRYRPGPPLGCPLTVYGGADDAESAPGRLEAWRPHTQRQWTLCRFPGDHFFLHSAEAKVLEALAASLHGLPAAEPAGVADHGARAARFDEMG